MEHFGAPRFSIAFNTLHKLPNALTRGGYLLRAIHASCVGIS